MPAFTPDRFVVERHDASHTTGAKTTEWISEAGNLTQFGAFIETLQPGSRSSIKHWHSAEDELVYVLDGEVTLIEGTLETLLRRGDAATFKAGVAVGHYRENRSTQPTRCFVAGTRAAVDTITYPDHDRILYCDSAKAEHVWTDGAGRPADSAYRK